jgi:hypothetical protein
MAVIAETLMTGTGSRTLTVTTLSSSDTLVYKQGAGQVLVLDNVTGGALTPLIDGAAGTNVSVPGVGLVSVAAGYTVPSIGAGARAAIPLDSISAFLQGVVTVTGGSGIKAVLLSNA